MGEAKVANWQVTFEQDSDGCAEDQGGQYMEVAAHDAGGGAYYTIKTQRWAFDTVEELIEVIRKQCPVLPGHEKAGA